MVYTVYPIVERYHTSAVGHDNCRASCLSLISYLMHYIAILFLCFSPGNQSDPCLLILEIPEEQIKDEITIETVIAERIKAGKKRAKKLKQRVAIRWSCDHYHSILQCHGACAELKITRLHLIQLNRIFSQRQNFGIFINIITAMILCLRFQKLLRNMSKLLETNASNIWSPADVQYLDRALGELKRSFASQVTIPLCSYMYCNEIMLFGL